MKFQSIKIVQEVKLEFQALTIQDFPQNRLVRICPDEGSEVFGCAPDQFFMLQWLGFSSDDQTVKRGQPDPFLFIAPDDRPERLSDLDLYSEFFLKFADECILVRFSGIDFSAGKFPLPAKVFSFGAQTYQ